MIAALTFGFVQRPAMTSSWHLWTVIIPRRTITGRLVRGQVWRRHDGGHWLYKKVSRRQLSSNTIDQLKTSLLCIRLTDQSFRPYDQLDWSWPKAGKMPIGDLSPKNCLVPVVATLHRVSLPCLSHL